MERERHLSREVVAKQIPAGDKHTLPAGTRSRGVSKRGTPLSSWGR